MADESFELDVLRDLLDEAGAIAQLAGAEKSFLAAYEAFRSLDRKGFQTALNRLKLGPRCRLVCEWIRAKECVFRCFELCGPPPTQPVKLDHAALAEAIVRVTSNEKRLAELVQAVEKGDRAAFQRIVKAEKLGPLCHFFCHWFCVVYYRLVCHWLCDVEVTERPNVVAELHAAGGALRALLEDRKTFDAAVAAAQAGDSEKLRAALGKFELIPYCRWICLWFCSWRCALVCITLCREFPLKAVENELQEALAFAKAVGGLAENPAELERLSAAVGAGDVKTFAAIVGELKLQAHCIQLCHWLCFLRCRRFCFLVCPEDLPWFTHIGHFGIYADIDPGTGLTNKAQGGHGGPDFGFFLCLELRGWCPRLSPAYAGQLMAYRFLFQEQGAAKPTPITAGYVCPEGVYAASRIVSWFDLGTMTNKSKFQSIWVRDKNPSSPPPPFTEPDGTYYVVPDPQGWVQIPDGVFGDAFSNALMGFASHVAFPGGAPSPGVPAGQQVPAGNQKNGVDTAIIFQATRLSTVAAVNGGAAPDYTNQLNKAHINNWDEVRLLDLVQFGPGGACTPLSTDLDIEYTVDHELIRQWYVTITTAAPIVIPPLPPINNPPNDNITTRGGYGTHHVPIASWPHCSYLVWLYTIRRLTTGLVDDDWNNMPPVSFCK